MLLHQTLDFEKSGEQIPFILRGIDRIGKRLVVVERLQKRIKGIPVLVFGKLIVGLSTVGFGRLVRLFGNGRALALQWFGRRLARSLFNREISTTIPWSTDVCWAKKAFVTSDGRRAWLVAEGCGLLRGGIARQLRPMRMWSRQSQATQLFGGEMVLVCVVAFLMEGKDRENLETLI